MSGMKYSHMKYVTKWMIHQDPYRFQSEYFLMGGGGGEEMYVNCSVEQE